MTSATNRRLTGHRLLYEGRSCDELGDLGMSAARVGRAKCECGATSEVLTNKEQRKQWHREHKVRVSRGYYTRLTCGHAREGIISGAAWCDVHKDWVRAAGSFWDGS